jgi:CHASE3 domain
MWSKIRKMFISPPVISAIPLIIVVTVGGYLSYRYNMILKDNRDLVVHTYRVISAVERAFSDIQDAETGQRGFIITGDEISIRMNMPSKPFPSPYLRFVNSLWTDRTSWSGWTSLKRPCKTR